MRLKRQAAEISAEERKLKRDKAEIDDLERRSMVSIPGCFRML